MLAFISLCLLARFAYAFNDIRVGAVAREYDRVEVASLRGLSLGITMAPLLLWVPADAFVALAERWPIYLLLISVTGLCNVLQNHAARFLPFGLRAAITLSAVSITAVSLGAVFFGERLSLWQGGFCLVLVGSAVVAAFGDHAAHEIEPNIPKGAALALGAGLCLGIAAVLTKRLAAETHPLLTAWAWEFGAGVILLGPLVWHVVGSGLHARPRPSLRANGRGCCSHGGRLGRLDDRPGPWPVGCLGRPRRNAGALHRAAGRPLAPRGHGPTAVALLLRGCGGRRRSGPRPPLNGARFPLQTKQTRHRSLTRPLGCGTWRCPRQPAGGVRGPSTWSVGERLELPALVRGDGE